MNLFKSLCVASFLAVAIVAPGCGTDDSPDVVDNGKTISNVEITTGIDTLTKGTSFQFRAIVKYADGTSGDVTSSSDTSWNTSDAKVATVDNQGLVRAISEGKVDITVTYMGVKAEESFLVVP